MLSYEQFIFEFNDGLMRLHLRENYNYIDKYDFILLIAVAVLLTFLFLRYVYFDERYTKALNKYSSWIVIVVPFILLFLMQAYGAILFGIVFVGFYNIIVCNEKYAWLKEKFEALL